MRYAGPCIGGPYGGQNHIHQSTRWPVYKPMLATARDLSIAAKVMPDVELPASVLLGHYIWDNMNEIWNWEPAI